MDIVIDPQIYDAQEIEDGVANLLELVAEAVDALAATNKFVKQTYIQNIKSGGSTADASVVHTINTYIDLGTTALPAE